jgi:hypothetical protein
MLGAYVHTEMTTDVKPNIVGSFMTHMLMGRAGGNKFLDMIFMVVLMYLEQITEYLSRKQVFMFLWKRRLRYTITSSLTYRNSYTYGDNITLQFKSVMHDMRKLIMKNDNASEYNIEEFPCNVPGCSSIDMITFRDGSNFMSVRDHIMVRSSYETFSHSENTTELKMTIVIMSKRDNLQDCIDYIKECEKEYTNDKLMQLKEQHLFVLSKVDMKDTTPIRYQEIPFQTTKSFDNMFFTGKDDLVSRIKSFMTEKDKYRKIGMPYTLGMMFHGAPGTGKTSAIKAIARLTGRHIVSIPVKKVTSIDILKEIFLNPTINDVEIPNEMRLYVFEEIDCGQWETIVQSRALDKATSKDKQGSLDHELLKMVMKTQDKKQEIPLPSKCDGSSLTLGEFLELLDGIIEIPGRMIIMTSNHPEKLDKALLRPGRVDMVLEFKKMTREDIASMYKLWFDTPLPADIYKRVKSDVFTQAEIGCLFNQGDLYKIHESLVATVKSHPID